MVSQSCQKHTLMAIEAYTCFKPIKLFMVEKANMNMHFVTVYIR